MSDVPFIPGVSPNISRGSNARELTPRAEVDACREIEGGYRPGWWDAALEYIARFNAEHPMDDDLPNFTPKESFDGD